MPKARVTKIFKFQLVLIGVILLIFTSICNTSKYGATLSWLLIGAMMIIVGGFAMNPSIAVRKMYIFLFWGVFAISTVLSPFVAIGRDLITFLCLCIVYLLASARRYTKDEINLLISAYLIITLFCETNIIYNWLAGNYYNVWFKRVSFSFLGVYKDPNYVTAFLAPGIVLGFLQGVETIERNKRIFGWSITALGVLCLFICGSRGALLSTVLAVVVYFVFCNRINRKKKLALFVLLLVAAGLAVWVAMAVLPIQAVERIFNLSDSRSDIWKEALKVFYQMPIIGGGLNAASTVTLHSLSIDSHNVYLDILCGSGIVGSILFIAFFFKNCFRCKKTDRAVVYSLIVVFMMPMMFINGFNTATFYVPLILLSIMSDFSMKNKEITIL